MKKVLALVLCAALLLSLAACGGAGNTSTVAPASASEASGASTAEPAAGEKIKVGYDIYFLGNSWSVQLYQEFKWNAENKFSDQIDVTYVESEGDISKQIANLEDLIAQEVDVIITTPNDTTALNATLQEAMDAGIKVILLCAGIDGDTYDTLITVDETEFGRVGAEWLVEQLGGEGKIICLNGISGLSTSELRYEGAKAVFDENPGIELLAVEDANWDYATGKTVTSDLLAAYPEIDGVWSQGGGMTLGAIEAFQAANRELVPMTGEDNNGLMKKWNELGSEGIGCAKPTWLSRVAIESAIAMMNGESVEKDQIYDVQVIATEDIPDYVHPDLSDDVWCGTELPEDVLKEIFS